MKDMLDVHLSTLKNQGLIDAWHDRRIRAGDEFDRAISAELDRADVILLLVSPDFLASNYIRDIELTKAMERHRKKEARVIPVILRHCDWRGTIFGSLLAAPKDGRPIRSWSDPDEAFLDVVRLIRDAIPTPREPLRGGEVTERRPTLAFKVRSPSTPEFIFPLPEGRSIKIGRDIGNDLIILSDRTVSRLHCIAMIRRDSVYIEDTAPTNPMKINGVKVINGEIRVRDKLELGFTVLILIPYA